MLSERNAWYICSAPADGTLKSLWHAMNKVGVFILSALKNG